MDSGLNSSQQCVHAIKKADRSRLQQASSASRSRETIIPLCSALVRLYLERGIQFRVYQCNRALGVLEGIQ